jgi:hypothetical protein
LKKDLGKGEHGLMACFVGGWQVVNVLWSRRIDVLLVTVSTRLDVVHAVLRRVICKYLVFSKGDHCNINKIVVCKTLKPMFQ